MAWNTPPPSLDSEDLVASADRRPPALQIWRTGEIYRAVSNICHRGTAN